MLDTKPHNRPSRRMTEGPCRLCGDPHDYTEAECMNFLTFGQGGADFEAEALGRPYPVWPWAEQIRKWGVEVDAGCYDLLRVFAVLACGHDYCPDRPDCWETRRAFCAMDGKG